MTRNKTDRKRSKAKIAVLIILAAVILAGGGYYGYLYLNNRLYDSELPVAKNARWPPARASMRSEVVFVRVMLLSAFEMIHYFVKSAYIAEQGIE